MVSKIETDRVNPSLTLLRRIAAALDINVAMLFSDRQTEGIVSRNGERPVIDADRLRRGDQVALERLAPHHEGALLQANVHIVGPGGSSDELISHVGQEVGYLLEGVLDIKVGDRRYRLQPGDFVPLWLGDPAWLQQSRARSGAGLVGEYPADLLTCYARNCGEW